MILKFNHTKLLFICLFVFVQFDLLNSQKCGISPKEATRIVGGSPAIPGAWPWIASIQYGKPGSRDHLCGGTLISSNIVVSAAHCFKEDDGSINPANKFSVRLGEHNIEKETSQDATEEIDVAELIVHPKYTDYKDFNDIAVLRLARHVNFNPRISPICLPYDSQTIRSKSLTGKTAMIMGWGATSSEGSRSATLLQASLKIVNPAFCKQAFSKWLTINDQVVCAASMGWDKDSCQGDSGGPLILYDTDENNRGKWYLIGVVSFGKKCGSKDMPGVYTKIGHPRMLAWLKSFF